MIGTIIGRLGKDSEVSVTSGGTQLIRFTVAENVYRGGKTETIWYDVTSYDAFAIKTQQKILKKGALVVVVGDVDSRTNIGRNGAVYVNHRITAYNINVPYLGNGEKKPGEVMDSSEPKMAEEAPSITIPQAEVATKPVEMPAISVENNNLSDSTDDDELPF